jgi:hypothetical protein
LSHTVSSPYSTLYLSLSDIFNKVLSFSSSVQCKTLLNGITSIHSTSMLSLSDNVPSPYLSLHRLLISHSRTTFSLSHTLPFPYPKMYRLPLSHRTFSLHPTVPSPTFSLYHTVPSPYLKLYLLPSLHCTLSLSYTIPSSYLTLYRLPTDIVLVPYLTLYHLAV